MSSPEYAWTGVCRICIKKTMLLSPMGNYMHIHEMCRELDVHCHCALSYYRGVNNMESALFLDA